ncbi:MAG: hypothetical protein H8E79_07940 [Desulfobulbaceae bacterium]|uniref:Uncharacterized protein n=1 Tax=Candidatus Desulfatifera sulfidica TaxID=2841691 RepID=A0A8J6TCX7_9BACT|nr:hypothetical protein [Candidatus Desulfatifera sulfidica]
MRRLGTLFILTCLFSALSTSQVHAQQTSGLSTSLAHLPFADYSYADTLAGANLRNQTIHSILHKKLSAQGFELKTQGDTLDYLSSQDIIHFTDFAPNNITSLQNEMSNDWSESMKDVLRTYTQEQRTDRFNKIIDAPGNQELNNETLAKLGRNLKADYVVRGRIQVTSNTSRLDWLPWHTKRLPFISDPDSHLAVGFANSEQYDYWPQKSAGVRISDNNSEPINLFGHANDNIIEWLPAPGTEATRNQITQIWMWVQEAMSGQIVWSNRALVNISSNTAFDEIKSAPLSKAAIEQAMTRLIDDFNAQAQLVPSDPGQLIASADPDLLDRIRQLEQENKGLQQQITIYNIGEKPSCWISPTGKTEYIFDATLTSKGISLQDRALPHRVQEQALLPTHAIPFNQVMNTRSFRQKTKAIFDWSVENECRFFVKVTDKTAPGEKSIYKHYMRVVGEHFYLYEPLRKTQ